MTRELDNLVAARQLKAEPGSSQEIATLLQRASSLLTQARALDRLVRKATDR